MISFCLVFFDVFYALDNIADISAFAFRRAGPEFIPVQAISRTTLSTGLACLKDRTIVKISKDIGIQSERRFTGMIEIQQSGHQFFKIGLISDDFDIGISQEFAARMPYTPALAALLEHLVPFLSCADMF
jgi:hypothetical protein